MRRERIDGQETREAILAAAEVEFAEKGFDRASTREICRRAGVNAALANRYFETKERLYRLVARRLFGELEEPMTKVAETVRDAASWRAAVRKWVGDFLVMAIPTARAQKLCCGLFRHEVARPTKFHEEFKRDFGAPVYSALWQLIAMAVEDPAEIALWTSSIWSQVAVWALADKRWRQSFRPKNTTDSHWREQVGQFICARVFKELGHE
ncbi:MAG: TetR/AcrR family transcriptional regulator [Kiritimatiellia bacterium]